MKQEDLEKGREDVLKLLITDNTEHEEELNRLMKQELSLNREMLQLGLERAVKVIYSKCITFLYYVFSKMKL